jgi:hypothetical protein
MNVHARHGSSKHDILGTVETNVRIISALTDAVFRIVAVPVGNVYKV